MVVNGDIQVPVLLPTLDISVVTGFMADSVFVRQEAYVCLEASAVLENSQLTRELFSTFLSTFILDVDVELFQTECARILEQRSGKLSNSTT